MLRRLLACLLACLLFAVSLPLTGVVAEDATATSTPTIKYSLYYNEPGRGGGYVTVSGVADGVYWLYWGQDASTNLDQYIYITPIEIKDGTGRVVLNQYLLIPEGASHLLLRTTEDALVAALEIPAANLYDASVFGDFEYSFVSVSDQHTLGKNTDGSYFANMHFMQQVLKLVHDFPNLKFIGDTGDLGDYPYLESLELFSNNLDAIYADYGLNREDIPFLANIGNHETWGNQIDGQKGDHAYAATFFADPRFQMVFGDLLVDNGTGNEVISHRIYPIPGTNDYVFLFSSWACMWEESFAVASKALIDLANTDGVGKIFCYQHLNVYGEAGSSIKIAGNAPNVTTANWGWDGTNSVARQNEWVKIIDQLQNVVVFNGHTHSNFNLNYAGDYFVASAGNGDYSRQIYVPSRWSTNATYVADVMAGKLDASTGLSLGTYQYVYEDALLSYGVDYNRYPTPLDEMTYQPVACLYIPYSEDSVVSNVEVATGSTNVFVNPEDAANGKDISLALSDAAGNAVDTAVSYRVTDKDFNTLDASVAYVQNGKLFFTDKAEKDYYHVVAQAGNHTVIFNVEYRSVYISSIDQTVNDENNASVFPAAPYLWTNCEIDNENHQINITMPSYNNPLVSGYSHSGGEGYTTLISTKNVDKNSANWRSYWGGLSYQFENAYLYDGQQITVTSDDGTESATYTVNLTFPAVDLEGEGTKENPYKVATLEDFQYIQNKINSSPWNNADAAWSFAGAYMQQTADIAGIIPIRGQSWTQNFWAHYDGNGYTLTFDGEYAPGGDAYAFCKYLRGSVKNLTLAGTLTSNGGTSSLFQSVTATGVLENIHSKLNLVSATGSAVIIASGVTSGAVIKNFLFSGTLNGGGRNGVIWGGGKVGDVYTTQVSALSNSWTNFTYMGDKVATGELAYKLNSYADENGLMGWGQDLSDTTAIPEIGSEHTVFVGPDGYTNTDPDGAPLLTELINIDTTNGASVAPSAFLKWKSYTIDHKNHTVNIVMPAYNYPRAVAYTHTGGTVSLLTGVTDTTAANANNYQSLTQQYVSAYLYEGQKLTAVSADGKSTAEYTVHITYPTLDLNGSGTEADPFLIEDAEDFTYMYSKFGGLDWSANTTWSFPNVYFRQTADISVTITPPDGNWHPSCWWANYDGAGHTLDVNATRTSGFAALFGNKFRGSLRNITLTGSITNATTSDNRAGLAAALCAGSVMENVHSQLTKTAYRTFILSSSFETGAVVENFLFTGTLAGSYMRSVFWGNGSLGKKVYTTFTDITNGYNNFTNVNDTVANGELLATLNAYAEANGLATWKQTVGTDATPILTEIDYTAVTVPNDLNGDGICNSRDAIYLLYATLLPDEYPLTTDCDFDGDNDVDSDDATYLLYHALLPEQYPID